MTVASCSGCRRRGGMGECSMGSNLRSLGIMEEAEELVGEL